ncbi:MAG: hypothetical protein JXA82_00555 [Sedimentisphaerales bacterium]|nr:hypothetical protein [Sedimentisphaerales bacterium]
MKHLIIWFTLGACLLLFGCQESNHCVNQSLSESKPAIDFCHEMDLFYNEDLIFSYEEDFRLFQSRIKGLGLKKTQLSGHVLCKAIGVLVEPNYLGRSDKVFVADVLDPEALGNIQ